MSSKLDKYALYIKTTQSGILKTLFEAIKDVIRDVNMIFTKDGMKITAHDESRVAFVNLKLSADKFRESGSYHCPNKLTVGVSVTNLNKFMKTISPNDIFYLYIHKDHQDNIGIKMENNNKNIKSNFSLNVIDLEEENHKIPNFQFNSIFTMPSQEFQKLCRDLNIIDNDVEIESIDNKLIFRAKGDIGSRETVIGNEINQEYHEKGGGGDESGGGNGETKGVSLAKAKFSLKYLNLFTKATNLCSTIQIFFNNDTPLIIEYTVASLGYLKFCLAPKVDEPFS